MLSPASPLHTLRAATADDLAFQLELYASTREQEMNAAQFTPEMRQFFVAQQFQAQMRHYTQSRPQAGWFIIECGGQRVGRLILDRAPDHYHIMDITLLPEFRCLGIGSVILHDVITEATAKQLPVRLMASTGARVLGLYHRLGFTDVRDDGMHTELVREPRPEA